VEKKRIKLEVQSLEQRVYEYLRSKIIDLEIRPGEYINIKAVADEIGVSTTPVRYALQRLCNEDLVDLFPRVGFFASKIEEKRVRDLFAVRKALELLALQVGFRHIDLQMVSELVKAFSNALGDLTSTVDSPPYELDYRLHDLIIYSSDNPYIIKTYNGLLGLLKRARNVIRKYLPSDSYAWKEWIKQETSDHLRIAKMILERDLKHATKALDDHLASACEVICRLVEEFLTREAKQ